MAHVHLAQELGANFNFILCAKCVVKGDTVKYCVSVCLNVIGLMWGQCNASCLGFIQQMFRLSVLGGMGGPDKGLRY